MLLNHFFKLRAKHSSVVAIKRDMEPIPFLALDDELLSGFKHLVSPECICPFARLRRSSGSRFALDLSLPTRARSSAFFRPRLTRPSAKLVAAAAASRATSARVNAGPRPARGLLNNGLPCGEGVCLGN